MSKSMLVALVALFFSLTGWGVAAKVAMTPANTVNTQSIVNGSIRLADLHPSAVRALKGQQGDPGQKGDPGPQGFTGATGPVGPAGAAGKSANLSQLKSDIEGLCRGLSATQKQFPYGTFYLPSSNFYFATCVYYY